ncbi:MAG: peptide chain release factor N(5)-glutamine methyltransferase [Spirochaetales bacterium]|nr:peptide chain release factor N(5)-glutamine methyltransferase [Spirochaetales bacterium]
MTIRELLRQGRDRLTLSGVSDTVDLDTSLLLCHVLNIGREQLFARLTDPVEEDRARAFLGLTEKRAQNFPVAYLTGLKEFFGRDFFVEEGVLCPRPDTEIIVEKSLEFLEGTPSPAVLDLCSGSGCIGLTLALERPDSSVLCGDIDETPEKMFHKNREALKADNARFVRTDLFDRVEGRFNLIATNPPYLTARETADRMEEGWKEPALALDGGEDGLILVEKIVQKTIAYLAPGGYLLIEAAPDQMERILNMMGTAGFSSLGTADDLAGRERVAYGRWIG